MGDVGDVNFHPVSRFLALCLLKLYPDDGDIGAMGGVQVGILLQQKLGGVVPPQLEDLRKENKGTTL